MKKLIYLIPALCFACSGAQNSEETKSTQSDAAAVAENCTYSPDSTSTPIVMWEAYKFTERTAVGGKIDSVVFEGINSASNTQDMFSGASFVAYTGSVNSNNSDRDGKLVKHFFSKLAGGDKIEGKVVSVSEAGVDVDFNINGVSKVQSLSFADIDGDRVKLTGTIDLGDFSGQDAVASINKVCEELHKGSDGISKLWPDIKVSLVAKYDKLCK